MAYGYYASITVDNTKVSGSSNLTNFPILVYGTYDGTSSEPDIRTTGNSGHVENTDATGGASGSLTVPADFVFSPNTDGSSPYDFEIVDYDASTGEIIAWVEIPSLLYASDTTLYMCYGDSGVTTSQEDVEGTWNSNYMGVWHLQESGTTYYDSTTNGNDLTGTGTPGQGTGKVGSCLDLNGSTQYAQVADTASLSNLGDLLVTAWGYPRESFSTINSRLFSKYTSGNAEYLAQYRTTGLQFGIYGVIDTDTDSSAKEQNAWHKVTIRWNGSSTQYLSVDGVQEFSDNNSNSSSDTAAPFALGYNPTAGTQYLDGLIDEVRVMDTDPGQDWDKTEFNTIDGYASFYTMGSEQGGGGPTTAVKDIIGGGIIPFAR